jgi:fatty acid desaturase
VRRLFRRPGAWPHVLAIGYTLIGWPLGIWMLLRPELLLNAAGVLLTAHTLVYSGYLLHDCAHQSIFLKSAANDRLGIVMSWVNGACLASYDRLKRKHLQHHTDRLDVVTFDYRAALRAAPAWVRRGVLFLEWAYIPAVELIMRGMIIAAPFRLERTGERVRTVALLAVRVAFFTALAVVSLKGVLLYALAYLLFVTVLRFMDAFQHTYEVYVSQALESAPPDPRRDRRYEYLHTYSNLVSERLWILNLLVLNFSYHNAHHARPSEAWYRLPALHRSLYRPADRQVITCRELLVSFHRHRLARVLSDHYGEVAASGGRASGFLGAVGVSFLTAV